MLTLEFKARKVCGAVLAALLLGPALVVRADAPVPTTGEAFHYRWQLNNILGFLAGLVIPRHGKGDLSFTPESNGTLKSELLITSPESSDGAYWRYGCDMDARTLQPLKAWSSYLWHGKLRSKTRDIDKKGVFDLVSAIYSLRRDPPRVAEVLDIWTDGDVFPVAVNPMGVEHRSIAGHMTDAMHYALRPAEVNGRLKWKGKVDLYYAQNASSTPVEIDISRSLADLHLELESSDAGN
jgi:hypothetical protein